MDADKEAADQFIRNLRTLTEGSSLLKRELEESVKCLEMGAALSKTINSAEDAQKHFLRAIIAQAFQLTTWYESNPWIKDMSAGGLDRDKMIEILFVLSSSKEVQVLIKVYAVIGGDVSQESVIMAVLELSKAYELIALSHLRGIMKTFFKE